jgi:nicotinamidase-related amidase
MNRILLIIDVQKYFINGLTKDLPEKIKKYIEQNRSEFSKIKFTQIINNEKNNFVKLMDWHEFSKPPQIDICDELKQFAGKENTYIKNGYSAFRNKDFAEYLKNNKIQEIWIAGINTENCVFATAIEAFDLEYRPVVLSKLCRSSANEEWHATAIKIMIDMIGEKQII